MAIIFPSLENINRLKVKPTDGERYLINFLIEKLPDDVEIYFQPFLNGDMPDIILIKKNVGVTVIEVKDWNLSSYKVNANNEWYLKYNDQQIKSPFSQVLNYKNNLFNLHISGLLEKKIKNRQFYGRIQTFVYFHKAGSNELRSFCDKAIEPYKEYEQNCHHNF